MSSRRWCERAAAVAAAALACALGCGRAATAPPAAADGGPRPRLEMNGNLLRFEGQTLRFQDPLEAWTRVLGPPSRAAGPDGNLRQWDRLGLQVVLLVTSDGRAYVSALMIWLPGGIEMPSWTPRGFPGVFVYQGVPLYPSPVDLDQIQLALRGARFTVRGWRSQEAIVAGLGEPDGFRVGVQANLYCRQPVRGKCVYVFDQLEITAEGAYP